MLYQVFAPPFRLAQYVRFFWALEGEASAAEEFVHRSMADGSVEIVFHYRAAFVELETGSEAIPSPLSGIQAQSTEFRRFSTKENFGIFGAYLFPFAIPRFFSLPAFELTNRAPDLHTALGSEGRLLEEEVIAAPSNARRVDIVSRFFDRQLSRRSRELPLVHRAIHDVMSARGDVNVVEMAKDHSLSTRQFERKFKEFAGLSPKLYSRVIRFQAATHYKLDGVRDLTEIAYACGYYDQSHFIRDFRQFSGYSPKEYFWSQAEGTQYMNNEEMSHSSNF